MCSEVDLVDVRGCVFRDCGILGLGKGGGVECEDGEVDGGDWGGLEEDGD